MISRIARRLLPVRMDIPLSKSPSQPASSDYRLLQPKELETAMSHDGWHEEQVGVRQELAWRGLIDQMYAGHPRIDLLAAAEALRSTSLQNPSVLEVGCGSGYYSEILPYLLDQPIHYTGLDYSAAMIRLARQRCPGLPFHQGDATALPFDNNSFDVAINGACLMHISDYKSAISETRRVARQWCIFHTVPVMQNHDTVFLQKTAYGSPVLEIIFNEAELHEIWKTAGLEMKCSLQSVNYNLQDVLGEPTTTRTYVCKVIDS